jgi:predicted nuclease of predicted toxin-antitoxin system
MKFLLNMNIPPQLGKRLMAEGHAYRHVRDIGMARADDREIVTEAKTHQEIILTHDLDYGTLLAFSGESKPSVVIFRLRYTHPDHLFRRMMSVWFDIQNPLSEGAIVVLEDATLRIRQLPIVAS